MLTYASQAWYPPKTEMMKIEQVQRNATKWITNGTAEYKERLLRFMEVHDILYLISVLEGNYEAKNMPVTKSRRALTRQQTELYIPQQRLKKCDENFWIRAPKLLNLVQRSLFADEIINKNRIAKLYHKFFRDIFNEIDSCSWRALCPCGNCNPSKKLVPLEN